MHAGCFRYRKDHINLLKGWMPGLALAMYRFHISIYSNQRRAHSKFSGIFIYKFCVAPVLLDRFGLYRMIKIN